MYSSKYLLGLYRTQRERERERAHGSGNVVLLYIMYETGDRRQEEEENDDSEAR